MNGKNCSLVYEKYSGYFFAEVSRATIFFILIFAPALRENIVSLLIFEKSFGNEILSPRKNGFVRMIFMSSRISGCAGTGG